MNRHRENTRKRRYRGGNGEPVAPTSAIESEKGALGKVWAALTDVFSSNKGGEEKTSVNLKQTVSLPPPAPATAPALLPTPSAALPQAGGRRRKHKASKKQRKHRKATKKHRKH